MKLIIKSYKSVSKSNLGRISECNQSHVSFPLQELKFRRDKPSTHSKKNRADRSRQDKEYTVLFRLVQKTLEDTRTLEPR